MSTEEYLVHLSDLTLDVEKNDIIDYFKEHGIEGITISVIKP